MHWTPFDYKNNFNATKSELLELWRNIEHGLTPEKLASLEYDKQCEQAALNAMSPMEVLESAMRMALHEGDYRRAALYAEKILPYKAPRLSAIATTEVKRPERALCFDDLDISELQALHRVAIGQAVTRH